MKSLSVAVCLFLAVCCSLAQAETAAYRDGQEQARKDLKAGEVKYMLYGQPSPYDLLFAEILKEDYQVTLVVVGGCTVSEEERERAGGYNSVALPYLKEKSKRDVIAEAFEKAGKRWKQGRAKDEVAAPPGAGDPGR